MRGTLADSGSAQVVAAPVAPLRVPVMHISGEIPFGMMRESLAATRRRDDSRAIARLRRRSRLARAASSRSRLRDM